MGNAAACVTCGTDLVGVYCHACGEKVLGPEDLRVRSFVRRAAASAFDADSRLWRCGSASRSGAYGDRPWIAFAKGLTSTLILMPSLVLYRAILFFTVYYTLD